MRGWVVIAFAFLALGFPMVLNAIGLAKYEGWRSDTERPADRGPWERICLASEAMSPACLLVGGVAQFRAQNRAVFAGERERGRIMPLACGVFGLALFIWEWFRWGPYTGDYFVRFQGGRVTLAWSFMWWCFVFLPLGRPAPVDGLVAPIKPPDNRERESSGKPHA